MSTPTLRSVHVDSALTNMSIAYIQKQSNFISTQACVRLGLSLLAVALKLLTRHIIALLQLSTTILIGRS